MTSFQRGDSIDSSAFAADPGGRGRSGLPDDTPPTPSIPSRPAPGDGPAARCFALVPCAGVGARSGADGPKQYASLAGRALVLWTLEALARVREIEATLVVLAHGDIGFDALSREGDAEAAGACWTARIGGATRADTVAAGLVELLARGARESDWVLVHDAARCLVRPESVRRLIAACRDDAVGGLLALPIADTLKRGRASDVGDVGTSTCRGIDADVDADPATTGPLEARADADAGAGACATAGAGDAVDRVAATVPRDAMWAAQTPQMFRIGPLSRALRAGRSRPGLIITDEASAIEAQGLSPRLVRGDLENLKVTWPEDFDLAERLLRSREQRPFRAKAQPTKATP